MLTVDKVRLILRIDEEDIEDEELNVYIDHFTKSIISRLGLNAAQDASLINNPTFEDALMAAIACNLSKTDLDVIHSPSGYKVGNTEEDYKNTSFGNYGQIPSWCNEFEKLLGVLSGQYASLNDIQVFRRRGMSVRRKWCRDLY